MGGALSLLVLAVIWCGCGAGRHQSARHQLTLRWPRPAVSSPITMDVGNGSTHLVLSRERDYVLVLPKRGKTGSLWIQGGHNVVLVGGEITIPSTANQTDNGADNTDTAIYIDGATGVVHIEGVLLRAASEVMFDGIDVNAPRATVQIENVRVTGVWGSDRTEHADVIQTWGGVRRLRIDRLSATGDYQGLTIAPDLGPTGGADIEDVDLTLLPPPRALRRASIGGGHMLWLTTGIRTCRTFPVALANVYIEDYRRIPRSDVVWPQARNTRLRCRGVLRDGHISWPSLPVRGSVTLARPPTGPFVPSGVAGPNYVSTGSHSG